MTSVANDDVEMQSKPKTEISVGRRTTQFSAADIYRSMA
jgi:hypothetical protein